MQHAAERVQPTDGGHERDNGIADWIRRDGLQSLTRTVPDA
jgi:hypothetical protein